MTYRRLHETHANYQDISLKLPVSKQTANILTSNQLIALIFEGGGPADFMDTYIVRFPSVGETVLEGHFSVGPVVRFMVAHPSYAIVYLAGKILMCGWGFDREYQKQVDAHKAKCSTMEMMYRFIYSGLDQNSGVANYNEKVRDNIQVFNDEIIEILAEDQALGKKYKQFKLKLPEHDAPQEKLNILASYFDVVMQSKKESADLAKKAKAEEAKAKARRAELHKTHGLPRDQFEALAKIALKEKETIAHLENKSIDTWFARLKRNTRRVWKTYFSPLLQKLRATEFYKNSVVFGEEYIVPAWRKLMALRTALFVAAFVYWLEWITLPTFTGVMDYGVVGLPPIIGFGVPILIFFAIVAVKTYHYFKYGRNKTEEELEKTREAEQESHELITRANQRLELKASQANNLRLRKELSRNLSQYQAQNLYVRRADLEGEIPGGGENAAIKASGTLITSLSSEHGADQYLAWLLTDLIQVVFHVALILPVLNLVPALLFLGLSVFLSVHSMMSRYREVSSEHIPSAEEGHFPRPQLPVEKLDTLLKERRDALSEANERIKKNQDSINQIITLCGLFEEKPAVTPNCIKRMMPVLDPKPKDGIGMALYTFFSHKMTGIFMGRVFLVAGTAILIFFAVPSLGVSALIGLGLLGLLHAGLKTKESQHKNEAKKRKELPSQIRQTEIELEIAKYEDQNLEMRLTNMRIKYSNNISAKVSSIGSIVKKKPKLVTELVANPHVQGEINPNLRNAI